MKTKESRFHVHDELTAPERSVPVLKGALAAGGQLSNIVGVLAGAPATLRAYARFRSELRNGTLPVTTQQRIALAVAEHQGSEYALATLQRTAREAGLGIDEVALAREFDSTTSATRSCCTTSRRYSTPTAPRSCTSTRRRARPAGTTSRSSKRWRTSRSTPSPTWSRGPETCRGTDRSRNRASPKPRRRHGESLLG